VKTVYFDAPVVLEGRVSKGDARNRRICVPQRHRDAVKAPGWVWMRVDAGQPFFSYARCTPSRASIDITLPSFAVPRLPAGRFVHVEVAPAETSAAEKSSAREDWLLHVDREHYFAQGLGDEIALWSGHEPPFFVRRTPIDEDLHWWLLGFYQAEGSKKSAVDFHVSNTNPALLDKMITALNTWGIDRSRLRLGLVHRKGTTDVAVRALFEPLELPIAFTRATKKNDPCGLLYVNSSLPLARMTVSKLANVFKHGFPSKEAALAYAIGWLDGDGQILRKKTSIELILAGQTDEHEVLKHALTLALGWVFESGAHHRNTDEGTRITLRASEMLDLLDVEAFAHSMNRARLLVAFDERTRGLRKGTLVGAYQRWGLRDSDNVLTPLGDRVVAGHRRHRTEIEKARQLLAAAPKRKGLTYRRSS